MGVVISVDPGTYVTGLVAWDEGKILATHRIKLRPSTPIEERLKRIVYDLTGFVKLHNGALVVCERPIAYRARPAPELETLFKRIRSLTKELKCDWVGCTPMDVKKATALKDAPKPLTKDTTRAGMVARYGNEWLDADPNLVDAGGVGHWYFHSPKSKQKTVSQ